ncbi:MAG TPA: hypothetical protein VMH89_09040, partial [Candidatus Acidoferrum sp.]|nr:hypothetical protein [Candidatus Acidoferrum sp.]
MNKTDEEIPISLIRGGMFYWAQEKIGLIRPHQWNLGKRIILGIALAWIPLVILTATHDLKNLHGLLTDYRVYARAFIAIPLLLLAQVGMERRFREMSRYFLDANLVRAQDLGVFQNIMQKARRLRDAKLPEILIVALVYLQVAYFLRSGKLSTAGWAVDVARNSFTPAGFYSILVTQVLFMGLLALVMWKWLIWILVMRDFSKMNLQLDPTDGDLTAGLGFLGEIPKAFAPVLLAISFVIGAAWRTELLAGQIDLKSLSMPAGVLVVVIVLIFLAPLTLFSPLLMSVKRQGLNQYGALQHLHSLEFRRKWVDERNEHVPELLGNPDFSSLADISSSFKNVEDMKAFPFRKSALVSFLIALAIPMLPV